MHLARFALQFAQGLTTTHEATCIVVFHTTRADVFPSYDDTALLALCAQFVRWWEEGNEVDDPPDVNAPRLDYSDETRLIAITAQRTQPTEGAVIDYTFGLPSAGTSPDGPAPPQAAVLLSWLSATDTRRGRGRTYLPAPRSGCYDPSGEFTTMLSALASEPGNMTIARWGRALFRNIADSAGTTPNDRLAIYSRVDGVARVPQLVRAPQYLATQRRRRIDAIAYEVQDFSAPA